MPGATVTVQNEQTGLSRTATTGADGVYRFPALPIGTWKLRAEKAGFSTSVQEGVQLNTNEAATVTSPCKWAPCRRKSR